MALDLFCLEVIALVLGGSLLGADTDAEIDADFDAEFEVDGGFDPDVTHVVDASDRFGAQEILSWLGIGRVPFMIWFTSLLTGFGLTGVTVQSVANSIFGGTLPLGLALLPAVFLGLVLARWISAGVARVMPKTESSAMFKRRLGGHIGLITQGTATAERPAEARIKDHHGNTHYLRVVDASRPDRVEQGTNVMILPRRDGVFTATPLT